MTLKPGLEPTLTADYCGLTELETGYFWFETVTNGFSSYKPVSKTSKNRS